MIRNILVFIALSLAFAANAQNGAYVEYKISSGTGAKGTVKINFSEFGGSSDFNMVIPQMPSGGFIYKSLFLKSNPDVVYVIDDKAKTYTETKKNENDDDQKNYIVTRIGEETVNGYKCIHAMINDGTESYEVWNTKDIPEYSKYSEIFSSNKKLGSAKREKALKDKGCDGLPVKTVYKGNETQGEMIMELVKLEKKNFSKTDFQIPAGYTKSEAKIQTPAAEFKVKTPQEIMDMTPEERAKYLEEMKKKYGK